jgi:hypothetical protein
MKIKQTALWILYTLILLGIIFSSLQYYHFTNEDAWISFTYARNLADGYGLVSNPGDVTQEGYSNLVLVLLLAFFRWAFNANIVHTAKIIGIVSFVAILFLIPAIVRLLLTTLEGYLSAGNNQALATQFTQRKRFYLHAISLLLVLAIGFSQLMSHWATQGLETILYALIVWGIIYMTLHIVLTHRYQNIWLLAILCFISANTRPEGLMNFFVALGVIFLSAIIENNWNRQLFKEFTKSIIVFFALVASFISFKLCYFGDIVANPSYIKLAVSVWFNSYPYFVEYFNAKGIAFTVLAAITLVGGVFVSVMLFQRKNGKAIINSLGIFFAFLSSQAFFIYYSGGDYMLYSRFIITHYPLLILSIVWLIFVAMVLAHRLIKNYGMVGISIIVAGILLHSTIQEIGNTLWRWHQVDFTSPLDIHQRSNTGYHTSTEVLNKKMAHESGYYAASEFGYVPYHVAAKGLDIIGLNQKEIARNFKFYTLEEAFYANRDFILSKKPVTIVTGHYYRKPDGKIFLEPAVSWFFRPYTESPFFWRNYETDVPNKPEEWTFSNWNGHFLSTHSIKVGDNDHYDKLMYGFHLEPAQIWASPLARVLLKRRANDKFLNLAAYIPDITRYPNQENILEIRVNGKAVGDQLFARKVLKQSGIFLFKVLLDDLVFREEDTLITLRGSLFDNPSGESRQLSYVMQAIYFSEE